MDRYVAVKQPPDTAVRGRQFSELSCFAEATAWLPRERAYSRTR
jgi:hypothetical protein